MLRIGGISLFDIKQFALHSNLTNVNYFNSITRADSSVKNRIKKGHSIECPFCVLCNFYLTDTNSVSNTRVALGGITPPAPLLPYPSFEGMISLYLDPTFIKAIPSSQPGIT